MKLIFFGTPYYVLPILEKLHKTFRERSGESPIEAVVTQSPKPVGRKQTLEYSAVDSWAYQKGITKFFDTKELIAKNINADVGVLASYGELLPPEVIKYFPLGILVIHPSLLPEFRWGSPVPAAIVTGTNPTGVTILKMDEKWDHGPIVTQFKEEVLPDDTYGVLRDRLFVKSAQVLVDMLPAYLAGKIKSKPQDDSKTSFARMITKQDAFIPPEYLEAAIQGSDLSEVRNPDWFIDFIKIGGTAYNLQPTPYNIYNFIRSMDPWPVAWTNVKLQRDQETELKRLKILKTHVEESTTHQPPSTNHKLVLDQVQLEGKNPVSWEEFKRGYPNFILV